MIERHPFKAGVCRECGRSLADGNHGLTTAQEAELDAAYAELAKHVGED